MRWKITVPEWEIEVEADDEGDALIQASLQFSFMNEARTEDIGHDTYCVRDVARRCPSYSKSEEGWLSDRCPNCGEMATNVPKMLNYWRCFHCDFSTWILEEAAAHFGDRDDPDECKPICKWWSNMDDAERRAQLQDVLQQLNAEREDSVRFRQRAEMAESTLDDVMSYYGG